MANLTGSRRALLDTNIVIHRETSIVVQQSIGQLFGWLDRLGYEKCVHPSTAAELEKYGDPRVRNSLLAKLEAYRVIKSPAPLNAQLAELSTRVDRTENDRVDTSILNELVAGRVDVLITEDRGVHRKATELGRGGDVFSIDAFLERVNAENPAFVDYSVLAVRRAGFGDIEVSQPFFDSFRSDYPGFDRWFGRKADDPVYVCHGDGRLVAFLYLKVEDDREPYGDISPAFAPARRLKIGTFKVEMNGFRIGERFLKIVFDNAVRQKVDEIYVTIFDRSLDQQRLMRLLEDFGFRRHGKKHNAYGDELVYVKALVRESDLSNPRISFPFMSLGARAWIVPIYPEYHTDLLPDSILRTENRDEYVDNMPHRNALSKSYVSRSINRDLLPGDLIVFYRTGGFYRGVATTIGTVEALHLSIPSEEAFLKICRRRTVFSDDQLRSQWRYSRTHPFVVDFLYTYSLPKRPNLKELMDHGIIQSAPRGFERLTSKQFAQVLACGRADARFIVD